MSILGIKLGKWVIILNVCLHLAIIKVGKHIFVPLMFFQSGKSQSDHQYSLNNMPSTVSIIEANEGGG